MEKTLPARVRLGEFEFDLKSGELRNGDQRVLLSEKPFRILVILVENGKELVSRNEIQKNLWPNDTIVDFEHSINTAMKRLRQALGDSADQPKYIETVPRRGYRLLVEVERVGTAVDDSSSPAENAVAPIRGPVEHQSPANGPAVATAPAKASDSNLIGKKVSHYRVLEIIGGGGMGLVYRAEDLKLGRQVALKFLPEEMAWDSVALQRFEREAQTASSLDHPNICTIHGVEEHDGQPFIVMQLLQGETLRDRLATLASGKKTLPLEDLLDIAIQITSGLQAAHAKGIIHRDIKPANIFLTESGQVKILDFGLAKAIGAVQEERSDGAQFESEGGTGAPQPARSEPDPTLTRLGVAIGTAGYMSPEQIRGEKLDARTDIFSFGLVLYEMATGQRAFTGETAAVVHEAILNSDRILVVSVNSRIPAKFIATIDKMLEKDRAKRHQSATDVREELEQVRAVVTPKPERRLRKILMGSFAILAVVAALLGVRWWRRPLAERAFQKYRMMRLTSLGDIAFARISLDGTALAYVTDDATKQELWLQELADPSTPKPISSVSYSFGNYGNAIAFANNSRYLYYLKDDFNGVTQSLYRWVVPLGSSEALAGHLNIIDNALAVSPTNNQIAFGRFDVNLSRSSLWVKNLDGSYSKELLTAGTSRIMMPTWSPDGSMIAFGLMEGGSGMANAISVVSVHEGKERRILAHTESLSGLAWLPDQSGLLVCFRPLSGENSSLQILSYPDGKLRKLTNELSDYDGVSVTGDATRLVSAKTEVESYLWVAPAAAPSQATPLHLGTGTTEGWRGVSWTVNDRLVFGVGNQSELYEVDRDGGNLRIMTNTDRTASNPSGQAGTGTIVFSRLDRSSNTWNVWAADADGSNLRQITHGTSSKWKPGLSPDGSWLTYHTDQGPWKARIDGTGATKLSDTGGDYAAVSPNGQWIAFPTRDDHLKKSVIKIISSVDANASRYLPFIEEPQVPASTAVVGMPIRWTADGKYITYVRTQNGVSNVWAQPIDGGTAKQLTNFNSMIIWHHDWSSDGKYLVMARGNFSRDAVMLTDLH